MPTQSRIWRTRELYRILLYCLAVANLAVIFFFWWSGSSYLFATGSSGIYIAFGRIFGLLSEFLILTQLVLIGRIRPVERLYGFDKLNILHRNIGLIIPFTLIFHVTFLTVGYAEVNNVSLITQFINFVTTWQDVWKALIGFILIFVVVGASLVIIRKKLRYETWYGIHLLVYLAIGLVFGHQINTADVSVGVALYYWLALNFIIFGLLILYRFLRPFYIFFKHRFYVEKIVQESHDIFSVYVKGKNLKNFYFEAGQFANFTILARGYIFAHPFSFSQPYNGESIRFSVKALGNFTNKIRHLVPGTHIIIDGPLGSFTESFARHNKTLLIAGGIGITPILALAHSLSSQKKDAILMYSVKTKKDFAFESEITSLTIPHIPFITYDKPGEVKMITVDEVRRLVPDFKERDIYICGPAPMLKMLSNTLIQAGIKHSSLHYERFGY